MGDRYRYPRPRSPIYNGARTSLPINISGWATETHHMHAVPSSRREIITTGPRSSTSSIHNPAVVTTYKIKGDVPSRASSTRESGRRRSTLDSNSRPPTIITTTNRHAHRPIIHSGGGRPESPLKNPYRSSEEEYYTVPSSSHGRHHSKRYSATMDNADMSRLARERDGNRLRVNSGRGEVVYAAPVQARPVPVYTNTLVRYPDPLADDYGEDGYGYTGPKDLVQYDLTHNPPRHHSRRDSSSEGIRSRPSSISNHNDLIPRSYNDRERGPPPSTRGFDKIAGRTQTYDPPPPRVPISPMEPVSRPAPFDPVEPVRRSSSTRPQVLYTDTRENRRTSRDDFYEVRDEERHRKPSRQDAYDDGVEQRGFGIRPERVERSERNERSERSERPRSDKDRQDRDLPDNREHKSRGDALATGVIGSIAGAALGINASKSKSDRDDRDDRDDRRRYEEERRRRDRERDERDDSAARESKERRYRDEEREASRDVPPPRDLPPPRDSRDAARDLPPSGPPQSPFLDPGRETKGRATSRDARDVDERRERRSRRTDSNAIDTDASDTEAVVGPRIRRESRNRRESAAAFNPKDTMDLKALKDALNAKDTAAPPKIPPKIPLSENRSPRQSVTKDTREVNEIRAGINDRRPRDPLQPTENHQLRVVSPPREKLENKPVKGILRQPRPKFPEDPSPIREGVAPLKDAKKDGVPPDARWTKISRKLVNPEALEAGKERFEAREDFVIVLRVLSRDEVQGYAEVTQTIRAAREREELEHEERRRARRERHERHKRERERNGDPRPERRRRHHRSERAQNSESDTTDDEGDDRVRDAPRLLEGAKKRATFDEAVMSGGLGTQSMGNLKENTDAPGTYVGYTRNPPPPATSVAGQAGSVGSRDDWR